ncbi:hypothetical protein GP486_001664 [Trichoglossum hirsutum]|uniref:CRA domain-containing protein n=1 Tax=Trichoglossum hirsutum TaxID=265104 RepID=A0A9P8LGE8_9PEZI|nr:hypothetical protein GP486_001664 [Trichoglossum hirsutum]
MDNLQKENERLSKKSNLSKSIDDVQATIDLLANARDSIRLLKRLLTMSADPTSASITLAKLQNPVKQSFDKVNEDLKDVHSGLTKYQKALDKKFKTTPFPTTEYDALASHPSLINRAIAMHLLREGQFSVASTFLSEVAADPPPSTHAEHPSEQKLDLNSLGSESLQKQFSEMYHILHQLRNERNLLPAIEWARSKHEALEARGSNLEFELGRLQFVWLFMGGGTHANTGNALNGPKGALAYARREFNMFQDKYLREIQNLTGALAFLPNLQGSPYNRIFYNDSAWEEVANSFTREFCSLLGLSADSPLYIAATAGAIALPTLLKLASIMKEKKTEWTTQDELPVRTHMPLYEEGSNNTH